MKKKSAQAHLKDKDIKTNSKMDKDKQGGGDRNVCRLNPHLLISPLHTNPFPHQLHIPKHTGWFCLVMLHLLSERNCVVETVFSSEYPPFERRWSALHYLHTNAQIDKVLSFPCSHNVCKLCDISRI